MYRWHYAHALPIRNPEGKVTSWVCSCADIHDQKIARTELEKQVRQRTQGLKESNIQLQHSNKNLEQFAYIASHDLHEPLRKIQTFTSMLAENYSNDLPDQAKMLVSKINGSSRRLSDLIKDVLHFSKIDHSQNGFIKTNIDEILNNVMTDFALLIDEKKAIIKAEAMPVIEVIPVQINQLFYNLLSNSLKFSRAVQQPVITITSRQLTKVELIKYSELDQKLDHFEILFADNGIGFKEKYKEKIFDIFQRLNPRTEYAGTGIGLALCKKIVLNHNGLIFAESHEGAGTLFHIILPLAHTQQELELDLDGR